MKGSKLIALITSLVMLVVCTTVLVMNFTFATSLADATAVYTRNNISWEGVETAADGTVDLNLFREPEEGEEYPLIAPGSEGSYRFRLRNDIRSEILYHIYLYTDSPANEELRIPMNFTITNTEGDTAITAENYPSDLRQPQVDVLCAYQGRLDGLKQRDFSIEYEWDYHIDAAHDAHDTFLGNKATEADLLYNFHILLVIEDYGVGGGGFGGGAASSGTSNARMLRRSYVIGREDGLFHPESPITRAEVATIFARIMASFDESRLTDLSTAFIDVTPQLWHTKYIASLETKSVINGYPNGTFKPDFDITRGEFAAVCVRYFEKTTGKSVKKADIDFSDLDDSHWAYDIVAQAYEMGYIKGYDDGTFGADKKITRSEAVTIVNRMLERIPDNEYIDNNLEKLVDFPDVKDNTYWAYYDIFEAANTHYIKFNNKGFAKWVD